MLPLPERSHSQAIRETLARENYNPERIVEENSEILSALPKTPFRNIGQKLSKSEPLSFEEAFLGMTYVVSGTNRAMYKQLEPFFREAFQVPQVELSMLIAPGQTFLTVMASREGQQILTSEEVAGMVAGAMMDINLRIRFHPHVLETGGMGGDKGFIVNGEKKKVINASTLSAIVLSSIGIPVVKHGSYANTSAVGSTEAIEALGMNIFQGSFEEIKALFEKTNFYFSDAHVAKTIHDLSHSPQMRYETINHVIGPMTPPVDRLTTLHKIIGVNEGIHPSIIAKAYQILHERGYQKVGNVIAIAGLSQEFHDEVNIHVQRSIRPYMMLDEVSPYATLLSVVQNGVYKGDFVVRPVDFGIEINPEKVQLVNTQVELLAANTEALKGFHGANSDFLALNAAVGLFAVEYLGRADAIVDEKLNTVYLKEAFQRCKNIISSGAAAQHLEKIIDVSNKKEKKAQKETLLDDIDAIIFDIDDTLIQPRTPKFYEAFSHAVNTAVGRYYGVSYERGKEIADYYRAHYNGAGELALYSGTIGDHFPELSEFDADFAILHDEMVKIDPSGSYDSHYHIVEALQKIRAQGKKIVALTDSPERLSRKLLAAAGINPDTTFDMFIGASREQGPHKLLRKKAIFQEISERLHIQPERILAVGDSFAKDIEPALELGMKGCYIGKKEIVGYTGEKASDIHEVFGKMGII